MKLVRKSLILALKPWMKRPCLAIDLSGFILFTTSSRPVVRSFDAWNCCLLALSANFKTALNGQINKAIAITVNNKSWGDIKAAAINNPSPEISVVTCDAEDK